jgi:AraC-like DNA-binding protein
MQFLSAKESRSRIEPFKAIPDRLRHHVIPGFRQIAYPTDFGMVLSQFRKVREFVLNIHFIYADIDGAFQPTPQEALHTIHYMYEGRCSAVLNGKGPVPLVMNEYNRFFVPASRHSAYFLTGRYCCIHLDLTPQLFKRYARELSDFKERMMYVDQGVGVIFDEAPLTMERGERQILEQILASRLTGGDQRKFLYRQCVELFTMYLDQHYDLLSRQFHVELTDNDLANLHAAKSWISQNLHTEITNNSLAERYGMDGSRFSKGFFMLFAQTVEEFTYLTRMREAAVLLVDRRLSIPVIMSLLNYQDQKKFENDIYEFYQMGPAKLRAEHPLNP